MYYAEMDIIIYGLGDGAFLPDDSFLSGGARPNRNDLKSHLNNSRDLEGRPSVGLKAGPIK